MQLTAMYSNTTFCTISRVEPVPKSFVDLSFALFPWSMSATVKCLRSFFLTYFWSGWEEFWIKINENYHNFHCKSFLIQFLINFLCKNTRTLGIEKSRENVTCFFRKLTDCNSELTIVWAWPYSQNWKIQKEITAEWFSWFSSFF